MSEKTQHQLRKLSQSLGYQFTQPHLLQQAMTHRSAKPPHNERLEFLGDGLLGCIIAEALFEQFPTACEGTLTRLRAKLVNGRQLAELAKQYGIGEALILGQGEVRCGGHQRRSILADALEAVIAAIFLDSDYGTTRQWVRQCFATLLQALKPENATKDPKTQLQELLQSRKLSLPEYRTLSIKGAGHAQAFTVSCWVPLLERPQIGVATSRREAEQNAAARVLEQISDA